MRKETKLLSLCVASYVTSFFIPVPHSLILNLTVTAPLLYFAFTAARKV